MNENLILIILALIIVFTISNQTKEGFDTLSQDSQNIVRSVYDADIEALRNLAQICESLLKDKLKIHSSLSITGSLNLNNPTSRGTATGTTRRALVHASSDTLAINFNGDYTGGVDVYNPNTVGRVKENGATLVPQGTIIMWAGQIGTIGPSYTTDNIPLGWGLCDGTSYTWKGSTTVSPDLRGRFLRMFSKTTVDDASNVAYYENITTDSKDTTILGMSRTDQRSLIFSKLDIGDRGGSDHVNLSWDEMPSHTHTYTRNDDETSPLTKIALLSYTSTNGLDEPKSSLQTTAVGNGDRHNNIPPYMVLAYLIKL